MIQKLAKTWIFKLLLTCTKIIKFLSYRAILRIGQVIGKIAYLCLRRVRNITLINLELCFPNKTASERILMAKQSFASLGMGIMETMYAWHAKTIKSPKMYLYGKEHLEQAKNNNENIIFLGLHQVSAELAGRLMCANYPFNAVYQNINDNVLNKLVFKQRNKIYPHLLSNTNTRKMVKLIQDKQPLWFAPDQAPKKKHCVFVPFFDIETASSTATSTLARLAQATVYPISCARTKDLKGIEIFIHPKLTNFPSDNLEDDAIQINNIFAEIIRKHPEQYLWQYKRFKTTKDGSLHIYDQKNYKKII